MNLTPIVSSGGGQQFLAGACRSSFSVAGITVELQANDYQDVELNRALLPFRAQGQPCDIRVRIASVERLSHCTGTEIFHSGSLWTAYRHKEKCVFDFVTSHLGSSPYKRLIASANFDDAEVELSRECLRAAAPTSAMEYPLDELLITHYLSLGRGIELHSCGLVGGDGDSFLFVGHSGAGKSTTARLWTRHVPVNVLSDDRIIVRESMNGFRMHGTPWHGEAAFASPENAAVTRIFFLEHGSQNRIDPISRSAAVGELLARSFVPFYQPRFVQPVLALLEKIVESVPCYRFQFVPDHTAVERILNFRE